MFEDYLEVFHNHVNFIIKTLQEKNKILLKISWR